MRKISEIHSLVFPDWKIILGLENVSHYLAWHTERKDHVQNLKKKNILNAWSKDIWKKCIHIFKLNIKWYSTCTEVGVNSPKILIHFYILYIHKWWALSHNKCLWTHLLLEFPIAKNLRNYIPTPEFSRHTTVHQHAHFTTSLSLIPTHNKHIENHLTQDD